MTDMSHMSQLFIAKAFVAKVFVAKVFVATVLVVKMLLQNVTPLPTPKSYLSIASIVAAEMITHKYQSADMQDS